MHELSLIANLFELLEEKAAEQNAQKIVHVTLQVGLLSGAVPELLKTAFDIYKKDTIAAEAVLEIEEVPLKYACQDCGAEMIKDDYIIVCDKCGSTRLKTLAGTDMFLLKMDIEV
jgi:hydrogenase nickel incorporation protein HypA/HybF